MTIRSAISRLSSAKPFMLLAFPLLSSCSTYEQQTYTGPPLTVKWPVENFRVGGYPTRQVGNPTIKNDGTGPAVCFSGSDDALVASINPLDMQTAFTIEALIKPAKDGAPVQNFLHLQDSEGNKILLQLMMGVGDKFKVHSFLQVAEIKQDMENELSRYPAEQWYWVAFTYNGVGARLAVNGREEVSTPVTIEPMKSGELGIGFNLGENSYFKGCVRELRFANQALPLDQLARVP
jgi:hypothetical protein